MTPYLYVIGGVFIAVLLYYYLFPSIHWITGYKPMPSMSVKPTATFFQNSPVSSISYQTSGQWLFRGSPYMALSFLSTLNTVQPVSGQHSTEQEITVASFKNTHDNRSFLPGFDLVYNPVGSLLFLKIYKGGEPSLPDTDYIETYIPLGSPPVRKNACYFIRLSPSHAHNTRSGSLMLELYIDGKLTLTRSFNSSVLDSNSAYRIVIGNPETPSDGIDMEFENLYVWQHSQNLSLNDIQQISKQSMTTEYESRQVHKPSCPSV